MSRIVPVFLLSALLSPATPAAAGVAAELYDWCLFPAVASAPGQGGTYFRTDVTLVNPYVSYSVPIQAWLLKNDQDNSAAVPVDLELEPGETVVVRDIVASLFRFTGGASLMMASRNGLAFGCNARTYTGAAGTYGFSGNGHYWNNVGTGEVFNTGLKNGNGYRTNLGLMSTSAIPITVEVNVYDSNAKLGTRRVTLPPYGRTQFSVSDIAPPFDNAYAIWSGVTDSEDATWLSFATVIDNASGDSVYVDDVYDGTYSPFAASFDLAGEWRGTAAWATGSRNLTALLSQAGPRLSGGLYDSDSGVYLCDLTGFEDEGKVFAWGTGKVLACRTDAVSVSGSVAASGAAMTLTMEGTGCFSTVAAVALQKHAGAARATLAASPAGTAPFRKAPPRAPRRRGVAP